MLQITPEFLYKTRNVRIYLESLLLDSTVPMEVYDELFGIKSRDIIDEYRAKYFTEYELPRFLLLNKLKSIKDKEEREVKLKVFYYGWEWVSAIYLNGRGVSGSDLGDKILRSMLSKLSFLSNSDTVRPSDLRLLKDLIKLITDRQRTVTQTDERSEIEFILSDLKAQNKRAQDAINELNKRPEDSGQTELVKKIEKEKEEARKIKEASGLTNPT